MDVLPEYLFTGTEAEAAAKLFSRAVDLEALGKHQHAKALRYNAELILEGAEIAERRVRDAVTPWSMPAPVETEVDDYTSSVRPAFLNRHDRRARVCGWVLNSALFACVVVSLYLFLYFAAPLVGAR